MYTEYPYPSKILISNLCDWLRCRKFILASCIGEAGCEYTKHSIGLLRPSDHRPREFIGVLWFDSYNREIVGREEDRFYPVDEKNWLLEVYGETHMSMFCELISEIKRTFGVEVIPILGNEEAKGEFTKQDIDKFIGQLEFELNQK